MTDLGCKYLGLDLKTPLVVSASPLSRKVESVKRLEEAGAGAVVLFSLFEEQLAQERDTLDHFLTRGTDSFAEALSYFPDLGSYNLGPDRYLEHIQKLKETVSIPIIASLNGISSSGWIHYSKKMEQAGADAIELNIYYLPTESALTSKELEESYIELVADLHKQIKIPLAVKLSPYFTSLPNFGKRLVDAGARSLVLFNRFYQPDLDIDKMEVVPNLTLSSSADLLLPLRWIAILYGRLETDFALTSGVHNGKDIVKSIMAGANVCMTASELILNGTSRIAGMLYELKEWMSEHEYESIKQMQGAMSQKAVTEPAAFERANYMKALKIYDKELPF